MFCDQRESMKRFYLAARFYSDDPFDLQASMSGSLLVPLRVDSTQNPLRHGSERFHVLERRQVSYFTTSPLLGRFLPEFLGDWSKACVTENR